MEQNGLVCVVSSLVLSLCDIFSLSHFFMKFLCPSFCAFDVTDKWIDNGDDKNVLAWGFSELGRLLIY